MSILRRKRQRLVFALVMLGCFAVAAALAGYALRDRLSLFFTPSEAHALRAAGDLRVAPDRAFRLGGLVADGSVVARDDTLALHFIVTDEKAEMPVAYRGIVPDLFREGQGVIATGRWSASGVFFADVLLAKHDEKYMPPEVARGLERARANPREGQGVAP